MPDFIVHPPEIIRHLFKRYTWKMVPEADDERVIYLTFDDGPIPEMTPGTLDLLAKYNAKATFFCVGDNVRKYPDIYKRIVDEGHSVGNHTYNHLQGILTRTQEYIDNVCKADEYINSNLFRPPHGRMKRRQTLELCKNRKIILWDILTKDYDKRVSPERCWYNVHSNISSGAIVVFHDNLKAMENQRYALEHTLRQFSLDGYTFKAIPYTKINKG